MRSPAPHLQSMVEAVVIVSNPGHDARWPLARVAGLPAVERNLMALRAAGVERATIACGAAEHAVLASHLERRRGDRRLPEIALSLLDGPLPDSAGILTLDGRRVYHPELLRAMLDVQQAGAPTDVVRPAPSRPASWYREDITTPEGRRRACRAIRQSLRKPTDGWFARTIDRSVSLAISAVLAPFPIHPNVVTLGTLLVGVASGLLAARGTYALFVAGGALFLLASVLDGVDGELARMKFQGTDTGQWLDTVCDDLTNAIYLAGVTAGTWRAFASPLLLWTGVAAVALDVVTVSFLYWQLVTKVNARTLLAFEETILAPALRQRGLARFVARLQPLLKRDLYAPLFLVFALAGVAWFSLPAAAVGLAVALVFLVRDFARARRMPAAA